MFCPNCGTQQPDTAAFCTQCGYRLAGAPVAPPQPQTSHSVMQEKIKATKKAALAGAIAAIVACIGGTIAIRTFGVYILDETYMNSYDEKEFSIAISICVLLNFVVSVFTAIMLWKLQKRMERIEALWATNQISAQTVRDRFSEVKDGRILLLLILNFLLALSPALPLYAVQVYACYAVRNTKKIVLSLPSEL